MKSTKKLLLILASSLLLTGCGGTNDNEEKKPDEPEEEVERLDNGKNKVRFKQITNLIMINEKAQKYIDKMKQQEKESQAPYRLEALDGIDNVDVSTLLSQSDNSTNRPIHIEWPAEEVTAADAKFLLCKDWKFNEYETYAIEGDSNSVDLDNLLRNKTYYYRIENADKSFQSQVQKFTTADYTRVINMKGDETLTGNIYNVRDEGGYVTSFGNVRTNQELIYRGSEINTNVFSYGGQNHQITVDDVVLAKNKNVVKWGLELDLRKDDAVDTLNTQGKSGLSTDDFPVDYLRIPYKSYADFVTDPDGLQANAIKDVFEKFAEADQKHVYFHCWGGADRTGALGFFLNGLLGVSYTDLIIDFELTTQNNSLRSHKKPNGSYDFPAFIAAIKADANYSQEKTIAEFCFDWLVAHGVTEATLEKIREIFIPGYVTGMAQEETLPEEVAF